MKVIIQVFICAIFGLACFHFYVLIGVHYGSTEEGLKKDPQNTTLLARAASKAKPLWADRYIQKAIVTFNGDITACSLYYLAAIVAAKNRDKRKMIDNLQISLYYNPKYKPAKKTLDRLNKL